MKTKKITSDKDEIQLPAVVEERDNELLIADSNVFGKKTLKNVLEEFYLGLNKFENTLLKEFENIVLEKDEDFVIKSEVYKEVLKQISANNKTKKEFIQSLIQLQKDNRPPVNNGFGENNGAPNSYQNLFLLLSKNSNSEVEEQIVDKVMGKDEKKKFVEQNKDFDPTKVFEIQQAEIEVKQETKQDGKSRKQSKSETKHKSKRTSKSA